MTVAASSPPNPGAQIDRIPDEVARLRANFDGGRTRPIEWRREQLGRIRDMLGECGDQLVAALQADLSKPTLEAWAADIGSVRSEAATARRKLKGWMKPERVGPPFPVRARIVREPLGVVLVISPWNYPVQLLISPLVGAIAAGNCAVLKPSEITAHTSAVLAEIVPRYLDPDAVCVVEGGAAETSALLEERFDHIFYTGNGVVGRIVLAAAAKHLTPVTLELGGKSPCIVDRSANIAVAARRIAWGKFLNAGQTCVAPDYVLVDREREDELVRELKAAIGEFYGDDVKGSADYARVVNDRHFERLAKLLDGADVAVGGATDAEQRYIEPTVVKNVTRDSALMAEEIFGPILPVLGVSDLSEAIGFVNEGEKPLALYLFTEDPAAEQDVLAHTSSGGVGVNATVMQVGHPLLPFGGVGESGMGTYHGRFSFDTFSHHKSVLARGTRFDPKMIYPPYSKRKTQLTKKFM